MLNIGGKSCWMCYAEQPLMGKVIEPKAVPVPAAAENPWFAHVGIWVGVITAVLVAYGVLRSGDGILATLFLLAAVPTLLIVMLGSAISRAAGKPWGTGTKVGVAAGSVLTTIIVAIVAAAVAVLVVFAMFIAMIQECFRALGIH